MNDNYGLQLMLRSLRNKPKRKDDGFETLLLFTVRVAQAIENIFSRDNIILARTRYMMISVRLNCLKHTCFELSNQMKLPQLIYSVFLQKTFFLTRDIKLAP